MLNLLCSGHVTSCIKTICGIESSYATYKVLYMKYLKKSHNAAEGEIKGVNITWGRCDCISLPKKSIDNT